MSDLLDSEDNADEDWFAEDVTDDNWFADDSSSTYSTDDTAFDEPTGGINDDQPDGVSAGIFDDTSDTTIIDETENKHLPPVHDSTTKLTATTIVTGLNSPRGIALDNADNLYFVEINNGKVNKIVTNDSRSSIVATLNKPIGIDIDNEGNVYIADIDGEIKKISTNGDVRTLYKDQTVGNLIDVVVDTKENVYFSTFNGASIKKIAPDGNVSTFYSGLEYPTGLAVDTIGNVYVAEWGGGGKVKGITPDGKTSTILASELVGIWGLAIDSANNLYVTGQGSYDTSGYIKEIFTNGEVSPLYSGLIGASDIEVDKTGNVYFSVVGNTDTGGDILQLNGLTAIELTGFKNLTADDFVLSVVK